MRHFISHDRLAFLALPGVAGGAVAPWSPVLGGIVLAVWLTLLILTIIEASRRRVQTEHCGKSGLATVGVNIDMAAEDKVRLCKLLDEAAGVLSMIPSGGFSTYDSGPQMAAFVLRCKVGIREGTITADQRHRLWGIFAPTCDWDDIGGGQDLGNAVFAMIEELYGEEIRTRPGRRSDGDVHDV